MALTDLERDALNIAKEMPPLDFQMLPPRPEMDWYLDPGANTFHGYRRVSCLNDNMAALSTNRRFPTDYVRWHTNRLPVFITGLATTVIDCPWCFQPKDLSLLEKDHIVPVQKYIRYRALQKLLVFLQEKRSGRNPRIDVGICVSDVNRWFNKTSNVIYCCAECNNSNSDDLKRFSQITATRLAFKNSNNSVLLKKITRAGEIRGKMKKLGDQFRDTKLANYIAHGMPSQYGWETVQLGENPVKKIHPSEDPEGKASYPNGDEGDGDRDGDNFDEEGEMMRFIGLYHFAMCKLFVRGRPAWTIDREELLNLQVPYDQAGLIGRLCYYCLGIYPAQTFQVDHVKAFSTTTDQILKKLGMENHLPICRPCNRAKSAAKLNTTWMNTRIEERQATNHPGIENSIELGHPRPYSLEYAKKMRSIVLGDLPAP